MYAKKLSVRPYLEPLASEDAVERIHEGRYKILYSVFDDNDKSVHHQFYVVGTNRDDIDPQVKTYLERFTLEVDDPNIGSSIVSA